MLQVLGFLQFLLYLPIFFYDNYNDKCFIPLGSAFPSNADFVTALHCIAAAYSFLVVFSSRYFSGSDGCKQHMYNFWHGVLAGYFEGVQDMDRKAEVNNILDTIIPAKRVKLGLGLYKAPPAATQR